MSLIAIVPCNCFKNERAKAPPFALEYLFTNEHGSVELRSPYDRDSDVFAKFHRWRESACSHPRMGLADFYLNLFGFRQVQWALSTIGTDKCQALREIMPEHEMQWTSGKVAGQARKELPAFVEATSTIESAFLIDSVSCKVLHSYAPAYRGIFSYGRTTELGVDMRGFFICEPNGQELFRAIRFEQKLLDLERTEKSADGEVEYQDLDTDIRVTVRSALSREVTPGAKPMLLEYPVRWHVERKPLGREYFAYFVRGLDPVLAAAEATGNDILWG